MFNAWLDIHDGALDTSVPYLQEKGYRVNGIRDQVEAIVHMKVMEMLESHLKSVAETVEK